MSSSKHESGHALPHLAILVAAAGVVLLGVGAANDGGLLALVGGVVGAVGLLAYALVRHVVIDWDLYRRSSRS